jgi:hypothetical protein
VQVTRFLIAVFSSRNRVSAPIPVSCCVFPSEDIIPLSRTFRSRELPSLLSSSLRSIRGFGATSPTGPRNSFPLPCFLLPHFHFLCLFSSSSCLSARTRIIRFSVKTQPLLSASFQMHVLLYLQHAHERNAQWGYSRCTVVRILHVYFCSDRISLPKKWHSVSCSGSSGFVSRPGDRLFWLRIVIFSAVSPANPVIIFE